MTSRHAHRGIPEHFTACIGALADVRTRPEVTLSDLPAPRRLAPFSTALGAEIHLPGEDDEAAQGRFVVLHDPDAPEVWEGSWRIVTLSTAQIEPELGADPLLSEVGWSWLCEALTDSGVGYRALGGTVTRVISRSFGSLENRPGTVEMELRASWTVEGKDLRRHLQLWTDLLCTLAGLPPLPEGVVSFPGARR
ncbi:Protein of unknown function [Austwickia chelonae]|uniref:Enoyl-CoA hydratase n=1 Tax=Austwickia chelonae NBRC 105200 TaxID=1184607 RepID=K6ULJ4_9MICO|nr:DUF3000 domain-containing protein [Austwickia chelonae]GAB77301.1 hypothetical protein AUCHE_05_02060 [Austwickia chelonae NBRC 105200]SEW07338.1 Protein of unknown function [Austwickia chelonae]